MGRQRPPRVPVSTCLLLLLFLGSSSWAYEEVWGTVGIVGEDGSITWEEDALLPWACQDLLLLDEPCLDDLECATRYCSRSKQVCALGEPEDTLCEHARTCAPGLGCKLRPRRSECFEEHWYRLKNGDTFLDFGPPLGIACDPFNASYVCQSRDSCLEAESGSFGSCTPLLTKEGEACAQFNPRQCGDGLWCLRDAGVCGPRAGGPGQPCPYEPDKCDETQGAVCIVWGENKHTCLPPLKAGANCTWDGECARGLHCAGHMETDSSRAAKMGLKPMYVFYQVCEEDVPDVNSTASDIGSFGASCSDGKVVRWTPDGAQRERVRREAERLQTLLTQENVDAHLRYEQQMREEGIPIPGRRLQDEHTQHMLEGAIPIPGDRGEGEEQPTTSGMSYVEMAEVSLGVGALIVESSVAPWKERARREAERLEPQTREEGKPIPGRRLHDGKRGGLRGAA